MSRILLTILITLGMFFPVWGPAIYYGIIKKRFPMDPRYSTSLEGTVKLWAINILIIDFFLVVVFVRGQTSDIELRTQKLIEGLLFLWTYGKWIFGSVLAGNFLTAAAVIAEKDTDPDLISLGSFILAIFIAIAAAIIYGGWKIASAIAGL